MRLYNSIELLAISYQQSELRDAEKLIPDTFFVTLSMDKPRLRKQIFWDTDMTQLDYEKHANAIIVRVLERGNMDEWNEIKRYYGHEKIKEAAMKARSLSKKTHHFIAGLYQIPLTDFRCYNSTLFPELQWMY